VHTVAPGRLGIQPSKSRAGDAVRAQRNLDELMRRPTREFTRLRGAERELNALAGIFRSPTLLKGSAASDQNLQRFADEGELIQFRYLHFATHGIVESQSPLNSSLLLSDNQAPDAQQLKQAERSPSAGRVTAEQIMRGWKLDADLVTLSACETGLGQYAGGEGYLGFSQALFLAGARSLILSLWKVDDASTTLLMTRFYENLAGRRPGLTTPMPKAQALAEAKAWLAGLRADEAAHVGGGLIRGLDTDTARGEIRAKPAKQAAPVATYPYRHPYYWAGFILIGDPK
jgi:CHAT domain-containing protein